MRPGDLRSWRELSPIVSACCDLVAPISKLRKRGVDCRDRNSVQVMSSAAKRPRRPSAIFSQNSPSVVSVALTLAQRASKSIAFTLFTFRRGE
jgi:hypothetical protein